MESRAHLHGYPTSTRKMRLMADLIRGLSVERALAVLRFSKQSAAKPVEKLVRSAIANWQGKNEGVRFEGKDLFIKRIFVDKSVTLKRTMPAPHGRAFPIKKRSNHVTVIVDRKEARVVIGTEQTKEVQVSTGENAGPDENPASQDTKEVNS